MTSLLGFKEGTRAMRRLAVIVVFLLAAIGAGSASAATMEYHVVNQPHHMSRGWLKRTERAIEYQMNVQVRPHWGTPLVRFGKTGTPVYFYPADQSSTYCGVGSDGCHDAAIGVEIMDDPSGADAISEALSHEIIEQTVDPNITTFVDGYYAEPADPVEGALYEINFSKRDNVNAGVMVVDFVYPRYYQAGSNRTWDFEHAVNGPLALNVYGGYYETAANNIIDG